MSDLPNRGQVPAKSRPLAPTPVSVLPTTPPPAPTVRLVVEAESCGCGSVQRGYHTPVCKRETLTSEPILLSNNPVPVKHFHQKSPESHMVSGQIWWCSDCQKAYELRPSWDGTVWISHGKQWCLRRGLPVPEPIKESDHR